MRENCEYYADHQLTSEGHTSLRKGTAGYLCNQEDPGWVYHLLQCGCQTPAGQAVDWHSYPRHQSVHQHPGSDVDSKFSWRHQLEAVAHQASIRCHPSQVRHITEQFTLTLSGCHGCHSLPHKVQRRTKWIINSARQQYEQ